MLKTKFIALVLISFFFSSCDDLSGPREQTNVLGVPSLFLVNSSNPQHRRLDQQVGRVTVVRQYAGGETSPSTCTVTHVGRGYFVSAEHCFAGPVRRASVEFGDLTGVDGKVQNVRLDQVRVVSDEYGLDLDLMYGRLAGSPPDQALEFPSRWPRNGEALYVVHYPDNGVAHVSEQGCRVRSVEDPFFTHNCATDTGSSGALLFAKDDNAVLGVHRLGYDGMRQGKGNNKATAMMVLLAAAPPLQTVIPRLEARAVPALAFGPLETLSLQANSRSLRAAPVPPQPYPESYERRLASRTPTKFLSVRPNTDTIINHHSRFQTDCSFEVPAVLFRSLPQNGQVKTEVISTQYSAANVSNTVRDSGLNRRCASRPLEYVQLVYEPEPGFVGTVTVTYDRVTGDQFDVRVTLQITVSEQASTERFPWDRPSRIEN